MRARRPYFSDKQSMITQYSDLKNYDDVKSKGCSLPEEHRAKEVLICFDEESTHPHSYHDHMAIEGWINSKETVKPKPNFFKN